jgi:hypothetical protein
MILTTLYNSLEKNPEIGVLSGLSAWVVGNIESINIGTDILKFVGAGLGVAIAGLTIYAKILDIKKKRANNGN